MAAIRRFVDSAGKRMTDAGLRLLARVDEPLYTPLNALGGLIARCRHPERMVRCGELHPERTFYVIDDVPPTSGVAGWYDRVLGYVLRARRHGWTPVVRAQPPRQPDDGDWYSFFSGPGEVPLSEVLQSQHVIFATCQPMIYKRYHRWNVARRHEAARGISFSPAVRDFIAERLPGLIGDMDDFSVGVRFRGTDYRTYGDYCPVGHAAVPEVTEFCDVIERDFRKWKLPLDLGAHIFVVTEEQESLDGILSRFPKARYVVKERYRDFRSGKYLVDTRLPTLSPYENNLNYLLEITALSRCDYLISGYNGAALMALSMNGNRFRGVHMIKTGVS